jgi:hypothetical protein
VVSVPLVRSNQAMTAGNTSRHSREPPACHIQKPGLKLSSDEHAIKLTRSKAAPLQRRVRGTSAVIRLAPIRDEQELIPTDCRYA